MLPTIVLFVAILFSLAWVNVKICEALAVTHGMKDITPYWGKMIIVFGFAITWAWLFYLLH